ncbi:LOW QUALITY PROTEIN: voltage-dependent T-type calcium channel subunit alpha-1H [Brachyhypopomus gauderio]|uniref:LOW QUALITY PROTEIN: voltage-dependent T-type calcium channel subunit alpha-1H n=1 Tax=Brachyhypopomus gauderio TaxID=698409 RepID=UPI004042B1E3
MTVGEETELTPWPDQGEVRLPIPAQCGGVQPENAPAGLAGTTGAAWESSGHEETPEDTVQLPHPSLAPVVFFCLQQSTRPRSWCLALVCSPWFERLSMLVILLNCVTLGMFQPCQDIKCNSDRCAILQAFDDFIFAFFAVEMVVKMVALGVFGPKCYLGDTWNRLDFFIVMAGMLEYSLDGHNVSFSAIRTVRVLRPLRAINRVPSMRILVTLLLDTLPMLGNVLLLCFFVFFIFGIVGVQLWAGLLRNRCFLDDNIRMMYNLSQPLSTYYRTEESDDIPFICSTNHENGMLRCSDIPPRRVGGAYCLLTVDNITNQSPGETSRSGCVNWNVYYNSCRASDHNPHNGAINFDNIGYAWIAIFQVITLEGWVDIMYYVMDAHSFYNFIYFIFLIIVGSFFMINLCLVVIATQFSETKQRENQLMREQRARFRSNDSTLGSLAEPGSCYEELLKYLVHLCCKLCRFLGNTCGSLCPWRRGKSSTPGDPGANSHWRKEKDDLAQQLCYRCPQHRVGNGADALEMKPLRLGGEGPPPKPAAFLPLSVSSLRTSYPTILPYTLFTRLRAARRQAAGVRDARQHSSGAQGSHQDTVDKHHGAGPVATTQAELPACPVCRCEAENPAPEAGPKEGGASNCFSVCVHCIRNMLRRIVDSKYFNRGIMIAILINTLSMGVEYHEQPAELTDVLEISNIVFTSLFALEMLLKLLACGLLSYVSNPYNIFDLIIVIISVWEIVGQADGGLSVLRTFRLLRVLKLVRFLPALRRQLVVLMKTMDNVATFCMLLMLFIFIFSILGMHLFGCRFTLRSEGGDTVSDRKNFDSLLWAIVTVFQILTQEDWNVVLYNGMASTTPWAALYFVALMTFGNYVLFNLLVAILVEGFQAEGDASRSESDDDFLSSDFDEEEKLRELISSGSEVRMQTLMPVSNGHLEPRAAMPPYNTHPKPSASPWTDVSHLDPVRNHNPWMLLYFISFLLIVSFFVLNMFVGVVVENFHKCRQDQEEEEARLREEEETEAGLEKMRRKALQRPYYADYSPARLYIHTLCTSHYLDLFITIIIAINVLTMSVEHYNQPKYLEEALKYFNYVFTLVFVVEAVLKLVAFGLRRFFKDRWNQLDLAIVLLSVMGITLEEIDLNASLPINPTIIRIMRVLRIARVLKLLKMAKGMRSLLDTVVQALPQVGNLGLLFMLLFFIYAALGVELFGKLECSEDNPAKVLSRHATFENFGMAFLTLFRVSTGDNWNGIMKDTLRDCKSGDRCLSYLPLVSPLYFVTFVLVAQFVLVNVVVAVLMKHLEESNKDAREEAALGAELLEELRLGRQQGHASVGVATELEDKVMGPRSQCVTPEQSDHPHTGNLLSVGKPSVSRMLSLPNDSYMFYPIHSGRWSHDLQLYKQQSADQKAAGSSFSVSSQLCERGSLLQVPGATAHTGSASHLESLPQFHTTRHGSLRTLQRQEAIKSDSVDSVDPSCRDNLLLHCSEGFSHLEVPGLPLTVGSTPCLPQTTPPLPPRSRTSSVRTNKLTYSQSSIPAHRAAPVQSTRARTVTGSRAHVRRPVTDEAGDEAGQLRTSSQRKDSLQPIRRCYTLSPCVSAARCSDSQSQTSQQCGRGAGHWDTRGGNLRKYYSMDARGFLAQPSCHSTEGEGLQWQLQPIARERRVCHPAHCGSASPVPKKEKMSPPCISIDPPTESDPPMAGQESSTVLRRRAPSFESAPTQEPLDLPHTPPASKPLAQTQPHLSSHLPLPQFSFDQSDVSSLSSLSELLSDSDQSSHSINLEAPSESVGPISATSHSSFRKKGLVRTVSSRDSANEDSVA